MEQARMSSSGTLTFSDHNFLSTSSNVGLGCISTGQTFTANTPNKMRYTRAALFNVVRDEKTNQIIDATLVKEFWVKVKPGVSFDVAAAHANGFAPDPDNEVIRELESIHF